MTTLEYLILGILIFSFLIPLIIIKIGKKNAIKKILKESEKFKNIDNYIKIKEYEFNSYEKISIFLLGASITFLLAFKVTNFGGAISYILLGVGFMGLLSTSISLNNHYKEIIKELYKKKDSLDKENFKKLTI